VRRCLKPVHEDLYGPIALATQRGSKYFLLLVYDLSGYMCVAVIPSKDCATTDIKEFQPRVEGESDLKLRALHTWVPPTYKLQVKTGSGVCTLAPPRALQYWTLPPSQGGLRSCHVSRGSRSHLPDRKGSGAAMCIVALDLLVGLRCAMCPVTPDPASLIGRAPMPPRALWLRTCWEGSGALCVLRLRILPP
jgi:hypothetical protein